MMVDTVFLEKGLKATFDQAMEGILNQRDMQAAAALYTEVPSTSASEKYGFLGDFPQVQEWLGDTVAGGLADYGYSIVNKDWYTAIDIDRNELKDDQLGRILPRIQGMAKALGGHKLDLLVWLLDNSLTQLAFDGAAYFANRAAPNDNLLAGAGVTLANILTDLAAARAAMLQFTTDQGRVLGLTFDTIFVPSALGFTMLQAVTAPLAGAGGGAPDWTFNPWSRWVKNVIALPQLSDTNDWYAFCTSQWMKPMVYQLREGTNMELDETQSARNRKLTYSANMRSNAGYGLPLLGVRIVN